MSSASYDQIRTSDCVASSSRVLTASYPSSLCDRSTILPQASFPRTISAPQLPVFWLALPFRFASLPQTRCGLLP